MGAVKMTEDTLTRFLRVSVQVKTSLLVHLSQSSEQKISRLVLHPVKLSALIVVGHLKSAVVPVHSVRPVHSPAVSNPK